MFGIRLDFCVKSGFFKCPMEVDNAKLEGG